MLERISGVFSANSPELIPRIPAEEERNKFTPRATLSRVLVVDDEKLIADAIVEILKRNGFEAIGTYGGEEALQVAGQFHPDYLLADILMPGMNGVQLAIALQKLNSELRILLFSGHASSADLVSDARREGHEFAVIPKPIHPEKLLQLLREKR